MSSSFCRGIVFSDGRGGLGQGSRTQIDVVRHAEIFEHLLRDFGENRRGDSGAVVVAFGRVHDDGDGDDRIVDGRKAGERRDVHGLGIEMGLRIDFLRGAGFAAGGVAVELRRFAGAEEDNALHHLAHLGGGERGDDAMRAGGQGIGQSRLRV